MRDVINHNGYYEEEGFNYPCCSPCQHKGICDSVFGCGSKYCYACNHQFQPDENFERKCKKDQEWFNGMTRNTRDNTRGLIERQAMRRRAALGIRRRARNLTAIRNMNGGKRRRKTRRRKQKGRGANICQMFTDPNKEKELDAMVLRRAKAGKIHIPVHPDTGEPLTTPMKMAEAHHYCQEMNDWNDNYKCNLNTGNCVEINTEAGKKTINDMLRMRGYK